MISPGSLYEAPWCGGYHYWHSDGNYLAFVHDFASGGPDCGSGRWGWNAPNMTGLFMNSMAMRDRNPNSSAARYTEGYYYTYSTMQGSLHGIITDHTESE